MNATHPPEPDPGQTGHTLGRAGGAVAPAAETGTASMPPGQPPPGEPSAGQPPPEQAPSDDPGPPPPPADLPVEHALSFGVEGYDPEDPWNAALYVETANVLTVLPLTPKTLGGLLETLSEVNYTQRTALGVGESPQAPEEIDRPKGVHRIAHTARVMTGSQPVYRMWNASTRGRVVIIGFAILFVVVGVILSVL